MNYDKYKKNGNVPISMNYSKSNTGILNDDTSFEMYSHDTRRMSQSRNHAYSIFYTFIKASLSSIIEGDKTTNFRFQFCTDWNKT